MHQAQLLEGTVHDQLVSAWHMSNPDAGDRHCGSPRLLHTVLQLDRGSRRGIALGRMMRLDDVPGETRQRREQPRSMGRRAPEHVHT